VAFQRGRSSKRRTPSGKSDSETLDQPRLLSPERLEKRARNVLLHQLARSAKSTAQLRKILEQREIPTEMAEKVIERFTEVGLIDDAAASYASQICDTQKIVTLKIDELVFKKPVKVGNLLKVYGKVIEFGNTSVSIYIEVRKHNVYNGVQETVTHTNIKFVRIDDEGNPLSISERIKSRYTERLNKFGRGLLSAEEKSKI
jgi:acyl-CoA hydrolase